MSYCRFSSNNFSSDLYIYESIDAGFVIHVASSRFIGDIPKVPALNSGISADDFFKAHEKQMKFLENAKSEDIELPYAGESFNFSSLE